MLSIAILIAHMCLAFLHTLYLLTWRRSSDCWDSITELLVLSQNSPAAFGIRNVSAGIKDISTFARVAKIQATLPGTDLDGEDNVGHVELHFGEQEEKVPESSKTTATNRYGTEKLRRIWKGHRPSSSLASSLLRGNAADETKSLENTSCSNSFIDEDVDFSPPRLRWRLLLESYRKYEKVRPNQLYS
jgi:hypothetical protein